MKYFSNDSTAKRNETLFELSVTDAVDFFFDFVFFYFPLFELPRSRRNETKIDIYLLNPKKV